MVLSVSFRWRQKTREKISAGNNREKEKRGVLYKNLNLPHFFLVDPLSDSLVMVQHNLKFLNS